MVVPVQKPGKIGRHRGLVDMGARPEEFVYRRPQGAEVYPHELVLFPGETCSLHYTQWVYRGKIVDFAITLYTNEFEDPQGSEAHVARYDCCHSQVHKHQYYRSGSHYKTGEPEQRTVIAPIDDPATAWDIVDSAFDSCLDDLAGNWQVNYGRWDTDGRQN